MEEMSVSQIKKSRALYLTLSTVTLLFLGLIYAFSMFAAPMCQSFGLEKSAVGLTFNIMMILFCIGAVVGSQIEKAVGVKATIIIGAVLFAVGFIGTALFANGNITMVYVFYGVCAGTGVGIGYNSIIATTNVWFPDKVGFSSGVLMMGFGLGSLILGTLSVNLFKGGMDLSTVFLGIGVIGGVVAIVAGLLLRRPPANIVQLMAPEKAAASGYDPAEDDSALKTPLFYVYWIWAIIVIGIGLATIGNCASDAQLVGWDEGFATLLVGLVSTCNGLARVVIGILFDKTNVKVTMLVDALVSVVATVSIVGAFTLHIPVLYVVGAFACGFCYGGVPVVASAFARQRFGAKNYPLNLSLANFAIVFGSILNLVIQGVLGGDARVETFIVLAVLSLLATFDVLPFSKMFNKSQKELDEKRAAAA
ncbi:MAG: OFA family MFS transporter [Eggerthellaceae bacterium]|nr:OFA family MFS transporter [Eggerthellaceae bacterium]